MSMQTSEFETREDGARPAPVPHLAITVQGSGDAPRTQRRIEWIPLAEDGDYAQHQVRVRLRYPDTLNQDFASGDFTRIKAALRKIVLEHNGWIDPDTEQAMPPVTEDVFWEAVAQEELLLMLRAIGAARKKLLNLLLPTSG